MTKTLMKMKMDFHMKIHVKNKNKILYKYYKKL